MAAQHRQFIAVALWVVLAAGGSLALATYSSTIGVAAAAPRTWPLDDVVHPEGELLLFAHALCPCTEATLTEFARWRARSVHAPRTRIVLWVDAENAADFSDSNLRDRASAMRDVEVIDDPNGALAQTFGVSTSGTLLVYGPDGQLRHDGGITLARGHEGGALGAHFLTPALEARDGSHPSSSPAFGCSLVTSNESAP